MRPALFTACFCIIAKFLFAENIIKRRCDRYKAKSLITSPARIMPATGGTNETLPGV